MPPANPSDVVVARWIAGPGEAGQGDIVGNVAKGAPGGAAGIRFLVLVDGVSLFDEVVAFDDTVGVPFTLRSVAIAEGSTTDFVVSKIGASSFDSTYVTAVITPAPAPSAPLLAALGASCCGERGSQDQEHPLQRGANRSALRSFRRSSRNAATDPH